MNRFLQTLYYPDLKQDTGVNKRNDYFDNLKFILITFVVVCHFALKLTYVKEIKYILYFIYIFHMPCFVFVNGFFAKRLNAGGRLRADKILSVFLLYLIFKIGNASLAYLFNQPAGFNLFKDRSAPWYLLALCIWYLSVPLLESIKPVYLLSGSFLIGLMAGYIKSIGDIFSLSRVFVFFPFFIIGFILSRDKLDRFLNKRIRIPAVLYMAAVFCGLVLFWGRLKPYINIIYGSSPYAKSFGKEAIYGAFIRMAWYLLAVSLSAALMLLVPRCRLFFTVLGERTLQVYMTHIWVRNALAYAGFFAAVKAGPTYYAVSVFFGSILLTFLLSNRLLKKVFDLLMAPKLFLLIIKKNER